MHKHLSAQVNFHNLHVSVHKLYVRFIKISEKCSKLYNCIKFNTDLSVEKASHLFSQVKQLTNVNYLEKILMKLMNVSLLCSRTGT